MYIADPAIGHVHTLGREVIQVMPKKEIQVWDESDGTLTYDFFLILVMKMFLHHVSNM